MHLHGERLQFYRKRATSSIKVGPFNTIRKKYACTTEPCVKVQRCLAQPDFRSAPPEAKLSLTLMVKSFHGKRANALRSLWAHRQRAGPTLLHGTLSVCQILTLKKKKNNSSNHQSVKSSSVPPMCFGRGLRSIKSITGVQPNHSIPASDRHWFVSFGLRIKV